MHSSLALHEVKSVFYLHELSSLSQVNLLGGSLWAISILMQELPELYLHHVHSYALSQDVKSAYKHESSLIKDYFY